MILIDQYINFIIANQITPTQYLLLHLLKESRLDLIKRYKEGFPTEDGTMIPKEEIKELVDKGFIIKDGKKFMLAIKVHDLFVTPEKAVDEIYDIYPAFLESDKGVSIPMNSMDKEVFKNIYIPKIMGNVKEHQEVLKDIEYGLEHNLLRMGINKFLTSEQWKGIRKLRVQENKTLPTQIDEDF